MSDLASHGITVKDAAEPERRPLAITIGSSEEYIERCAVASSRASQDDPLTVMFQREKKGVVPENASVEQMRQVIYHASAARLRERVARGAVVAECNDFATVACWTPPNASASKSDADLDEIALQRPFFADFLRQNEKFKEEHLFPRYGQNFWYLSLMARDPMVPYVSGTVRAVVEPFLQRASEAGAAVWLIAGSPRARDIYAHFGFTNVASSCSGSVETWCMIKHPGKEPPNV